MSHYGRRDLGSSVIRFGRVSPSFDISPKPPIDAGVYLFLGDQDRVFYVGMAHSLEAVLYRYQHLKGRQKMRERAAAGRFSQVAWLTALNAEAVPSLERVCISHFRPPWNDQHNLRPRSEATAIPFDTTEREWLVGAERRISATVSELL